MSMKPTILLSLCLALSPTFAADTQVDATTAYQQAVNAYVDAAGKEVLALKTQVAEILKGANEAKQAAYAGFLQSLKKYEVAYEELKQAAPKDFDRSKALYETRRKEALKVMSEIKVP